MIKSGGFSIFPLIVPSRKVQVGVEDDTGSRNSC
jgi:hypothetical protein